MVLDTQLTVVYRVTSFYHLWSKMHLREKPDAVMGSLTAGIPLVTGAMRMKVDLDLVLKDILC